MLSAIRADEPSDVEKVALTEAFSTSGSPASHEQIASASLPDVATGVPWRVETTVSSRP